MYNPVVTYRLQFHKEFTFDAFERILPYLQKLGVGTIYASPIFESTPGSTHGYDGINPHRINPEIGNEEQLRAFSTRLKAHGIGWLQDIVPNHMAFYPGNSWLMDVLENGRDSEYASFFDILWDTQPHEGKLMVPFLGATLDEVVNNGELKVAYEAGRVVLKYYDSVYPVRSQTRDAILLPSNNDPKKISGLLEKINKDKVRLTQIANEQHYRLCHWQETDKHINYRRFFTVNGLICLNIQDQNVFDRFHQFIRSLTDEGIFQGLRVDHIDGLYDPAKYLEKLRELAGDECYLVVEKILEPEEDLPASWPIQGNTGYDFLSMVNNLFTSKDSEPIFTKFYEELVNDKMSIHQQISNKKAHILYHHMAGELDNLYHLFIEFGLAGEDALARIQAEDLKKAIGEFLVQCRVYRYYAPHFPLKGDERDTVKDIFKAIKHSAHGLAAAALLLEEALLHKPEEGNETYNEKALHFYRRCMQFSGPLMAKGVEDTLMYTYNRFIGHNEVGDAPESFGCSVKEYHRMMIARQEQWPLSINATSTHDTKRGEDVRARLNVLTDLPGEWVKIVKEWARMNKGLKENKAPDTNDEYFIYQTLVGAHPMPGEDEDNFSARIGEYLQKALREAKLHTGWTAPDEAYESAAKNFADQLLKSKTYLQSFHGFQQTIVDAGIVNSLSQLLLKFTCPGVPDVYQGTELWDLSLVDPDNRRPVNYERRLQILDDISTKDKEGRQELISTLWEERYNAHIKLWLVNQLMQVRKQDHEVFAKGMYIPLEIEGKYKDNILAFARRHGRDWYIIAVPLHIVQIANEQKKPIHQIDWKHTRIILPDEAPSNWESILQQTKGKYDKGILVKEIFGALPFVLLKLELQPHNKGRSAGVLLPVAALPSRYGVGDFGPEARAFADFLSRSCQKYWQILPLNPTERENGHSPYSSISSMAGNTLLLSPDLLVSEGLLDKDEVKKYQIASGSIAEYEVAEKNKSLLFELAYANFKEGAFESLKRKFATFCNKEAYWLNPFSLFVVLKEEHDNEPWYEWPDNFKKRNTAALDSFQKEHSEEIEKVQWLQFLFSRQWRQLRAYCNTRGIHLLGDMPFYISYDSVDVWSNPELFCLDNEGNMTGVAGVPPDYFSTDGQLWGMPTFNWDVLKEQGYKWWIARLKKNLELFDLLRIDHFRAMAEYWQVPASEATARNGKWLPGPGREFFDVLKQEIVGLPFVAEDLGDNMELVYKLRDEVKLPGMKVLQFAFGDNLPVAIDIPHNYTRDFIVYTGTHDNNTTLGWYRQEEKKSDKKRLQEYVGRNVHERDIHLVIARMAYASVAKTAILPVQDILGLDETARMNMPGSSENNWLWRLQPDQLTTEIEERLRTWTKFYNRL